MKTEKVENYKPYVPTYIIILCMIAMTLFIIFSFAGPLNTSPEQLYIAEKKTQQEN